MLRRHGPEPKTVVVAAAGVVVLGAAVVVGVVVSVVAAAVVNEVVSAVVVVNVATDGNNQDLIGLRSRRIKSQIGGCLDLNK